MTPDDLSPMLSQPADDNAPMISGRGTKIIADARGAYLAGNLRALIGHLDNTQQLRFRQAFVSLAIWGVARANTRMQLEWVDRCIQIVQNWVAIPSPNYALALNEILVNVGIGDGYYHPHYHMTQAVIENFPSCLHWCIACESLSDASEGASDSIAYYAELFGSGFSEGYMSTHQWQIEAAWAILQGKEPPPFELPE